MNQSVTGPPPGRYGEPTRARRLGLVAAAVVVAAGFFSWVLWAALGAATPDLRSGLLSFRVLDDERIEIRFEVVADRDTAVTCRIQAIDRFREVVGTTQVVVPPGAEDRRVVAKVLRTRGRALIGTLEGCRPRAD